MELRCRSRRARTPQYLHLGGRRPPSGLRASLSRHAAPPGRSRTRRQRIHTPSFRHDPNAGHRRHPRGISLPHSGPTRTQILSLGCASYRPLPLAQRRRTRKTRASLRSRKPCARKDLKQTLRLHLKIFADCPRANLSRCGLHYQHTLLSQLRNCLSAPLQHLLRRGCSKHLLSILWFSRC